MVAEAASGRARQQVAQLVELQPLDADTGIITLAASGLALGVVAGRFAMLEAIGRPDCILLRPFSYFATDGPDRVLFLLKDIGAGTRALLRGRPGDAVRVLGPLGSTFPEPGDQEIWAVAGGVGAAPFGLVRGGALPILFGARTAAATGFAAALQARGAQVELATDDGSQGFAGSVVELLAQRLAAGAKPDMVFVCGPTPMMAAAAKVAQKAQVVCHVSLEARMGCGIGVCRGCAHLDAAGTWRCICVDGPVYDAAAIFS